MPEPIKRSDVWQNAALYERFVGRWSRRVAADFLAWLALPLAVWQGWTIRRYLGQNISHFQGLTMRALSLFAVTASLWVAGYALLIFRAGS